MLHKEEYLRQLVGTIIKAPAQHIRFGSEKNNNKKK